MTSPQRAGSVPAFGSLPSVSNARIAGRDVGSIGVRELPGGWIDRARSARCLAIDPASLTRFRRGLPWVDESAAPRLDLLLCVDVLPGCWDPPRAVAELARCLRPDGELLVVCSPSPAPPVLRTYDPHSLGATLGEAFAEVRVEVALGAGGPCLVAVASRPRPGEDEDAFDAVAHWNERMRKDPSLRGTGTSFAPIAWQNWLYRGKVRALRRLLRRAGVELRGTAVLDYGCGVGFFEDVWEHAGAARTAGIDVVPELLDSLRRAHPARGYLLADLGAPEAPAGGIAAADLVTAIDVLYHVVDDERWARAVGRLLAAVAPGGAFLFTDPLRDPRRDGPHVRFRPLPLWQEVLADHGFEVVDREPVFAINNRVGWWSRRAPGAAGCVQHALDAAVLRVLPGRANNWAVVCRRAGRQRA